MLHGDCTWKHFLSKKVGFDSIWSIILKIITGNCSQSDIAILLYSISTKFMYHVHSILRNKPSKKSLAKYVYILNECI